MGRIRRLALRYGAPLAVGTLLIVILLSTNDELIIADVAPKQFAPDDRITITGSGFGQQRGGSNVVINDSPLTQSEYIEWDNNRIVIRAPIDVRDGTLWVEARNTISNKVFITNSAYIAAPAGYDGSREIQITAHSPQTVSGGDIVTF